MALMGIHWAYVEQEVPTVPLEGLQVFTKCGILKEDDDRKPKVKVYRDRQSQVPKGDGLVTYLKEPSVSASPPVSSRSGLLHASGTCKTTAAAALNVP